MLRIPLCPPELKSLYFEKITEIQAFLLPIEGSLKRKFEVAYDCFTVKNHTKSHENHTKFIGGTKLLKKPAPFTGAVFLYNMNLPHFWNLLN